MIKKKKLDSVCVVFLRLMLTFIEGKISELVYFVFKGHKFHRIKRILKHVE